MTASWPHRSLESASRPGTASFRVEVGEELCAGPGVPVLFGGWAMAAMVDAAQAWSGLRMRSLRASFLAPVRLGDTIVLDVAPVRRGSRLTHAALEGRVGGALVLSGAATLAAAAATARGWRPPPPMPRPEDCPGRSYRTSASSTLTRLLDVRLASPEPDPRAPHDGSVLLWARLGGGLGGEGVLTVLSDHVPYLIVRTVADVENAITVDASVRVVGALLTEWVMLEVRVLAGDGAYAVGQVTMWDAAGALVATAEQTTRTIIGAGNVPVADL